MNDPYKILFVDDNMEHISLMQQELLKADVKFISKTIKLKQDFIPTLESYRPHIIISNHHSQNIKGEDVCQLIKQEQENVSFIIVADSLNERELSGYIKEGVDDYVLTSDIKRLPLSLLNTNSKNQTRLEMKSLSNELMRTKAELKFLSENYQSAREEEKLMVSRELHDELGQILTALKIDITLLSKKVIALLREDRNEKIKSDFEHILNAIDNSTHTVRKIAAGLRPDILDKLGIIDAIEWLAEEVNRKHGIKCNLVLPQEVSFRDGHYSITLFRIVQETLTNIVRHAEASEVLVELIIKNESLYLTITDNGKGIAREEMNKTTSLGLIGLRERVHSLQGQFTINGSEKKGTVVSVIIPIGPHLITKEKV